MRNRTVVIGVAIAAIAVALVAGQLLLTRRTSSPAPVTPAETTASTEITSQTGVPGVIPPLPGGKPLAAVAAKGPAKDRSPLHPLSSSPTGLIAGLVSGRIPAGSAYTVRFEPWGYGPAGPTGQTVVITVAKFTPIGMAPDIDSMSKSPLLAVMDARQSGNVSAGGTQSATLTFLTNGTSVVPVLTNVSDAP